MAFDGIAPVIDADGHINDWHLEWQQRVPPELREFAPRSIIGDNGWRQLEIDGRRLPTGGTRRNQKTTTRPAKYWASNRPGEQRPEPRLPDMDEMGIDVAVLFGGHCFLVESVVESQKAAIATLRAYNDYLIDYCSADRKRLKGAAMVPIQSGADAAAELRRAVEGGLVAGVVPPHHANGMMLSSRSLYPLYEAAQDLGVPICVHTIGIQINPAQTLLGEDEILRPAYGNISSQMALGSLIVGGVLDAFPRLTVAFLEAG
ncbi:MAG: amidohydrolase family protein, partial [Fimbriimonas ginsengisoli]|nr:amidohydrolase family protein [Fimbriimonas ginsengisoli]